LYGKVEIPKCWRVRGTATDGLTVTLGRHETAEQAGAYCRQLAKRGAYCDLVVQPIEPGPDLPSTEATARGTR
jgi:hypothetical protein